MKTIAICFFVYIMFMLASASASYECFNKDVAQMQLKQAKWLKAKIEAKRSVNQWTLLCNKSI